MNILKNATPVFILALLMMSSLASANSRPPKREFYQLKIYHLKDRHQEERVDKFLKEAFIPAAHRHGIKSVGVFKPLANDTAKVRRIYILLPVSSLDQLVKIEDKLATDKSYQEAGKEYHDAEYNDAPFLRVESILLRAFKDMPVHAHPSFKTPKDKQVYELRSYEGPTEKKYWNKVHMFNEGGEIPLFDRLGFNAVFYGEVIAGSRMPNLMYITSFEDSASNKAHWKAFSNDPEWKKLSAMPEYQHNVSHIDIILMRPAEYSEM